MILTLYGVYLTIFIYNFIRRNQWMMISSYIFCTYVYTLLYLIKTNSIPDKCFRIRVFKDYDEKIKSTSRMRYRIFVLIKDVYTLSFYACSTRTSPATAMYAFYYAAFLEFAFWHSANAICAKIGVSGLYTS